MSKPNQNLQVTEVAKEFARWMKEEKQVQVAVFDSDGTNTLHAFYNEFAQYALLQDGYAKGKGVAREDATPEQLQSMFIDREFFVSLLREMEEVQITPVILSKSGLGPLEKMYGSLEYGIDEEGNVISVADHIKENGAIVGVDEVRTVNITVVERGGAKKTIAVKGSGGSKSNWTEQLVSQGVNVCALDDGEAHELEEFHAHKQGDPSRGSFVAIGQNAEMGFLNYRDLIANYKTEHRHMTTYQVQDWDDDGKKIYTDAERVSTIEEIYAKTLSPEKRDVFMKLKSVSAKRADSEFMSFARDFYAEADKAIMLESGMGFNRGSVATFLGMTKPGHNPEAVRRELAEGVSAKTKVIGREFGVRQENVVATATLPRAASVAVPAPAIAAAASASEASAAPAPRRVLPATPAPKPPVAEAPASVRVASVPNLNDITAEMDKREQASTAPAAPAPRRVLSTATLPRATSSASVAPAPVAPPARPTTKSPEVAGQVATLRREASATTPAVPEALRPQTAPLSVAPSQTMQRPASAPAKLYPDNAPVASLESIQAVVKASELVAEVREVNKKMGFFRKAIKKFFGRSEEKQIEKKVEAPRQSLLGENIAAVNGTLGAVVLSQEGLDAIVDEEGINFDSLKTILEAGVVVSGKLMVKRGGKETSLQSLVTNNGTYSTHPAAPECQNLLEKSQKKLDEVMRPAQRSVAWGGEMGQGTSTDSPTPSRSSSGRASPVPGRAAAAMNLSFGSLGGSSSTEETEAERSARLGRERDARLEDAYEGLEDDDLGSQGTTTTALSSDSGVDEFRLLKTALTMGEALGDDDDLPPIPGSAKPASRSFSGASQLLDRETVKTFNARKLPLRDNEEYGSLDDQEEEPTHASREEVMRDVVRNEPIMGTGADAHMPPPIDYFRSSQVGKAPVDPALAALYDMGGYMPPNNAPAPAPARVRGSATHLQTGDKVIGGQAQGGHSLGK